MIQSSRVLTSRKATLSALRETKALVDHEWVTTGGTPFTVFASSRPLTMQEAQMLLEGQRSDSFRVINCDDELFVADDKLGVVGDIIAGHLGFDWRVVGATRWGAGFRHNSYKLQKIKATVA